MIAVCTVLSCTLANAKQQDWKILKVPPSITVKQDIDAVPEGWEPGISAAKHILASITVFDGRPEEMAALVYSSQTEQKSKKRLILGWQLAPISKDGIWIQCGYASTGITLSAPLPKNAAELRVMYSTEVKIAGLQEIIQIEYR